MLTMSAQNKERTMKKAGKKKGLPPKRQSNKHLHTTPKSVPLECIPSSGKGWASPLCCVGSCMEGAVWRFQASPRGAKLPYCDKHLPKLAHRLPGTMWELRFKPVGQPAQSNVPDHVLVEALVAGFRKGALECLVRRVG